jgi:dihydroneopterin aldolase
MANYQVSIDDIRIFAFHGLYPEERILGNWYTLDVLVESESQPNFSDDIANTIDYSKIYTICKQVMAKPVDLLETVAETIAQKIRAELSQEVAVKVQISKENPPMGVSAGRSTVVYRLN